MLFIIQALFSLVIGGPSGILTALFGVLMCGMMIYNAYKLKEAINSGVVLRPQLIRESTFSYRLSRGLVYSITSRFFYFIELVGAIGPAYIGLSNDISTRSAIVNTILWVYIILCVVIVMLCIFGFLLFIPV